MTDCFSPEKRSEVMRAVGSSDTAPEMRLRRALWGRGLRYRVNERVEGTRPDIVFQGPRVAVFVDGCFWHGCPQHYTLPATNRAFWRQRMRSNQSRDSRNDHDLREAGWLVERYWECQINTEVDSILDRLELLVRPAKQ